MSPNPRRLTASLAVVAALATLAAQTPSAIAASVTDLDDRPSPLPCRPRPRAARRR